MNKDSAIRIQVLQHEPFEGAGLMDEWAREKGHPVSVALIYNNEPLPQLDTFDWLIIMGGAMSVNDEHQYSWLKPEKEFIRQAVKAGKVIIGICLGSQLIANALGQKVYKNRFKEIGWFPILLTEAGEKSMFFNEKWENQLFFHWHGETYDLPENAVHLAYTEGCKMQAFSIGNRIFGFQFHPETNSQTFNQMIHAGGEELIKDKYVMTAEEAKQQQDEMNTTRSLYFEVLDKIAEANVASGIF